MKPSWYMKNLDQCINWPGVPVTLDFETFYDTRAKYSLREMSIEEYVRDPRFLVHGMSVKVGGMGTRWLAGDTRVRQFLKRIPLHKGIGIAHNARFDGFILSEIYKVKPYAWIDTMSLAAVIYGNNLPSASLKSLSARFLPSHLQKDAAALVRVDGKRQLTAQEMKDLGAYAVGDADRCYALYQQFKQQLQHYPLELAITDLVIRMFTDPCLVLDGNMLQEIVKQERQDKRRLLQRCIAPNTKALNSNKQFAALLESLGVTPPRKLSITTNKETWAFAQTDREFMELATHPDEVVRNLIRARLRVKSNIEETRAATYSGVAQRGTWPVALNISGARTTHRLSGSADGGGNPQNLGRIDKSRLRLAINPPPDHHILVIDSSGIELRVGMTLTGEKEVVAQWRTPGFDLYRAFAAYLFNVAVVAVTAMQRRLGKVAMLSLQYGSGAEKFQQSAWEYGIDLSFLEAAEVVAKYRRAFPHISRTWKLLSYVLHKLARGLVEETHFHHLVRANPQTMAGCPGFDVVGGTPITYPGLSWQYSPKKEKNVLMYLTYVRQPRDEDRQEDATYKNPSSGSAVRQELWGAKAFEHICQNAARNIVLPQTLATDRWLKTEVDTGCKTVLSVHDEGVFVIPDSAFSRVSHDAVLQGALEIFRTAPSWWPDIPLEAEATLGKTNYGGAKP